MCLFVNRAKHTPGRPAEIVEYLLGLSKFVWRGLFVDVERASVFATNAQRYAIFGSEGSLR